MACSRGWAAQFAGEDPLSQAEYVKTRVLALYACHTIVQ